MNFLKALFGGAETSPEEEKEEAGRKQFDLMKYDGVKAMKMGHFDYAVRCFEEALRLRDDLEVHDYLAQSLVRLDRLDEAVAEFRHLIEAQPQNESLILQLARVFYIKEDYASMFETAAQAITANPESATAYYMQAQATLGQGDLVGGIARLTKAIALDGNLADARLLRAQTLLKMGDVKGADEDSLWLTKHVGDHEDVLLLAARVTAAKGESDKAIALYSKVIDVNPFMTEAYAERGKLYYDQGNSKEAKADMQKVLELDPQQMADVSGEYSAEGVEQKMKQAYSSINPFGL